MGWLKEFWAETVNTSCHIGKGIHFRAETKKTSYEIRREKKPKVKYFRIFGSKHYILNDRIILMILVARSYDQWFYAYKIDKFQSIRSITMVETNNMFHIIIFGQWLR